MDTTAFYGAAAALCFTLLGFWWVVVQFRHDALTRERSARRFSFLVSLHFILPGLASLASLLTNGPLWRVSFGLTALTGIAAVVVIFLEKSVGPIARLARASLVTLPVYVVIGLVALVPDLARTGLGAEPLQVEGLMLVLVVLIGVLLAWELFTNPTLQAEGDAA
jgi:hypothetical protein